MGKVLAVWSKKAIFGAIINPLKQKNMKKMMKTLAIAALTLALAACGGNKGGAQSADGQSTEAKGNVSYITYTNEKYGYSVEVPDYLTKRETMVEDNGTIFSDDGAEGMTLNRIDIGAYESMFVEEYTPEKVKEEFDEEIAKHADDGLTSSECGDNNYTYSLKGEYVNEMYYVLYKGNKSLSVTICYEPDHAKKFEGEVADHVFKSAKFN